MHTLKVKGARRGVVFGGAIAHNMLIPFGAPTYFHDSNES